MIFKCIFITLAFVYINHDNSERTALFDFNFKDKKHMSSTSNFKSTFFWINLFSHFSLHKNKDREHTRINIVLSPSWNVLFTFLKNGSSLHIKKVWEHHVYKNSRFFVLQKYPQKISGGSCMMDIKQIEIPK